MDKRTIGGGAVAGVVGGLGLTLLMAFMAWQTTGIDVWMSMKGAGAPFLGERASVPGFDLTAVLVGLVSHYAVSVIWGVLFAIFFVGLSRPITVAAGAGWGILVWIGMFYGVLPLVGLAQMAESVPVGFAIAEHVFFGLLVGAGFLPFQHEVSEPWLWGRRTRQA